MRRSAIARARARRWLRDARRVAVPSEQSSPLCHSERSEESHPGTPTEIPRSARNDRECCQSERAKRVEESRSLSRALMTAFTQMDADELPQMHADSLEEILAQ